MAEFASHGTVTRKFFIQPGLKPAIFLRKMRAACYSIAERWDAIEPPEGAVF